MGSNKLIFPLLILLPLAVFCQTVGFDFVWDDEVNVAANRYFNPVTAANVLRFWQEPYERLYIPLSYTVWAAIASFARADGGGLAPSLFHLANVAFHLLSGLTVFAIIRLLFRHDWAACAGALLFALHPIQVEPVAWITGMKDVLSGLCALLAVWQYLNYSSAKISLASSTNSKKKKADAERRDRASLLRGARIHYLLAITAFVFALLAKPAAVVTPVIAWLLDRWLLARPARESARALASWLIIAIAFVIATKFIQPESELEFVTPFWARPLVAADALGFYLYKFFLPLWLSPDYGRLPEWVMAQKWSYFSWLIPCAMAIYLWLGKPRRPWLVAGAAIFAVGILPVSGLLPFSFQNMSTVADRYLYLAMLGPALAVGGLCSERKRKLFPLACGSILLLLAFMSAWQARHWHNDTALFIHARTLNPASWTAHYSLGRALAKQGRTSEAIASFRAAVRLKPEFTNAHFSLGSLLARQGELDGAITAYRDALRIAPGFIDARLGLANALAMGGEVKLAIQEYGHALKIDPRRIDTYFGLGNVLARGGDLAGAAEAFRQAVRIRPDFVEAYNSLGRIVAAQGDLEQATEHFREALRIRPSFAEAHQSLALALSQLGRTEEAQRHANEARMLEAGRSR